MSDFQITGVSSGIDWGTIIDTTIESERTIEYDWLEEQEDIEGKMVLYEELDTYLEDLRDCMDPLEMESTFLNKTADINVLSGSDGFLSISATSDAEIGKYSMEVLSVAKSHSIAGSRVDNISSDLELSGDFSLAVGDFEITVSVSSTDSLSDVVSAINSAVEEQASEEGIELPFTAKIMDNTLILASGKTGEDYAITTTDGDGVLEGLGILDETGAVANELQAAKDASIKVDGLEITRSSNTIDDVIEGLTLEIAGEGTASVDVTLDAETAVNSINSMIEAYNATLEWINIRLTEESVEDPQSDVESRWGLLRGDSLVWGTKQNMRDIASMPRTDSVDGEYKTLSSIGIATESVDYGKSGKLEFDESSFMEAMLNDPSAVKDLMNSFATEMKDFTESMISNSSVEIGGTTVKEGSLSNTIDSLQRSSSDIDERIEELETRLALEKASLETLYANMETTLSELTQQASYLSALTSYNYDYSSDS